MFCYRMSVRFIMRGTVVDRSDAVRIVLADPDTLVREGLRALAERQPGLEVVGQAADGPEVTMEIERLSPEVLVTEATLPGVNMLEIIPRFKARNPGLRILVLSNVSDRERVNALLEAGVTGYLPKSVTPEEFLRAIRAVMDGQLVLHAAIGRALFGGHPLTPEDQEAYQASEPLTEREKEVLALLKTGHSNKDIAQRLYLSVHTVEVHLRNIYGKLGVRSRLQAALHPTDKNL